MYYAYYVTFPLILLLLYVIVYVTLAIQMIV